MRALTWQERIATNIGSIFGVSDKGNLAATREWRLRWWRRIVGYTVHGDYFWTGKGFGIDLAVADGILPPGYKEVPNRNPHNVHMTVLARAGIPGLVLWMLIQGAFAV